MRKNAGTAVGILGLAQGFVALAVGFLPAEPNVTLAKWLFVGAAVCVVVGLLIFFWPQRTEGATQTATQSGSRNVQIQGQTVNLQQGPISTGEEERETTLAEKRAALEDLFWRARNEGSGLRSFHKAETNRNRKAVEDWRQKTHNLIEAAYGISRARHFDLPGELVPTVEKHLSRLDEIMAQVDLKEINPDFDPQEWEGHFNLE